MHFSTSTGAAVLLALAPTALSVGTARVVSNCAGPVYFASVAQSVNAAMNVLPESGMSEGYSIPGVGVSIKLAPNSSGPVTQFEYTWQDGSIYYDISNINGNPFFEGGMELVPSMAGDPNYPTCAPVTCAAGASTCTAAYNAPDDTKTMVCSQESDLVMTLCPFGSTKREVQHAHNHRLHARHLPKLA